MKFSQIVQTLAASTGQSPMESSLAADPEIMGVAAVDQADPGTLSFIDDSQFERWIQQTRASGLILPQNHHLQAQADLRGIAWMATSQPRMLFAQAVALFYQPYKPTPGIHPTVVVHPSVQLGKDVFIGSHVSIQAGAQIGNGVCIHPNVVIYPGVSLGDRTVLHANCVIHERAQIGADCVIHSGAVIGAEGFGFVPTPEGWFKMQQSGRTVLEDGVEVGCNSAIDRPAVGETLIAQGTKIDNLVQIGHGCQIGEQCVLAGQVGLTGGVRLGKKVILAGQVGVANQAKVGDRAVASAQAGITKDVDPGAVMSGGPAIPHKTWLRAATLYSRLPEIYQTLKQIQRRLEAIDPGE